MASNPDLFINPVFQIGPLVITNTVVISLTITGCLGIVSWWLTRRLQSVPSSAQIVAEGLVSAIDDTIRLVLPEQSAKVLPFIGTLWIFIVTSNLASLIPAVRSPTGDLSTTAALALLVFLAVHWFGIREQGIVPYLRHYLAPNPILLPFHVISEISRTAALAIRLFGNIFSLQMAALLILLVAGFLVPIPVLMLHIVEALVQAYIFGTLALIYVGGAMQSQHSANLENKESAHE